MRPTAKPLLESAVGLIAIAHQPTCKGVSQGVGQDFFAAVANKVQADGGAGDHPQPQGLSLFRPWSFIGVSQRGFPPGGDEAVFKWLDRPPRFVETLVQGAGTQI